MNEVLPKWVADEVKTAHWASIGTWKYSGYILDLNKREKRVDVQFYDKLPEGRYIATIDIPEKYPIENLQLGKVYMFEFSVFEAGLSERLIAFLKESYSTSFETIHRYELISTEELE